MNPTKYLTTKTGKAIGDFNLIKNGDRILVALSGGKDSWTLLHVLYELRKKAPVDFELHPVTINPGFPDFDTSLISEHISKNYSDLDHRTERSNISEVLSGFKTPGKSICSFCSRLRRGILYRMAFENNYNKIALGHHADDFIETLLLNQFFNGRIKSMSPLLHSEDGKNTVIRPLCYVDENIIINFIKSAGFPIPDNNCPAKKTAGNRLKIKNLITDLSEQFPGIKSSLLKSLSKIDARHMMDKDFWPGIKDLMDKTS